jgi:uncharacterized protein (DUF305 family)
MKLRSIVLLLALASLPTMAFAAEMKMAAPDGDAAKAFAAANDKMMKAMTMAPTGNADADFVMMMIPHHQGAIDMAQVELQYGKDPMLREMAQAIIKAQQEEIATMKKWQQEHGM